MHGKNRLNRISLPFFLGLSVLILSGGFMLGEEPDTIETDQLKEFAPRLWQAQKRIWTSPLKSQTWEHPVSWIFAGTVAGSFTLDDGFSRDLRENHSFGDLNRVLASRQAELVMWAIPVATMAVGEIGDFDQTAEYGWKLTEGAVNAFLVSRLMKLAAGRSRPHNGDNYNFFSGGDSFPSGHSILAWTLAETTVRHYPGRKWIPWVAYPLAGLVAFSRISSGNHYASDAVTGSLIGFSIGHWAN